MAFALAVFIALVLVTIALAPLTEERSALRAGVHHAPILAALVSLVVIYSLIANTTVLDRLFYTYDLQRASGLSISELFNRSAFEPAAGTEPVYLLLLWIMSRVGSTTSVFFLFIALTTSLIYLWPLIRLLAWWQATFIFMLALGLGTFTDYTSVVARQSVAMSLISAAICWGLIGRRHHLALLLAAIASLAHWSALPFALVVLLSLRITIPLRLALVTWLACAMLLVTGSQERLLGGLAGYLPKQDFYTSTSLASEYSGGVNRLDFLAVSALMLVAFLTMRWLLEVPDWYTSVLVVFIGFNSIFLLGGFVYYSDRLAAYSWYLAPLLAAAPLVSSSSARSRIMGVGVAVATGGLALASGPFALSSPLWSIS